MKPNGKQHKWYLSVTVMKTSNKELRRAINSFWSCCLTAVRT